MKMWANITALYVPVSWRFGFKHSWRTATLLSTNKITGGHRLCCLAFLVALWRALHQVTQQILVAQWKLFRAQCRAFYHKTFSNLFITRGGKMSCSWHVQAKKKCKDVSSMHFLPGLSSLWKRNSFPNISIYEKHHRTGADASDSIRRRHSQLRPSSSPRSRSTCKGGGACSAIVFGTHVQRSLHN